MIRITTITVLRYADMPLRWWPKVRRYGFAGRRSFEIDWLHLTIMLRR